MGYRHYFYSVPKTQIEEIKKCKTNDEFCDWAESKGYEVERYEGKNPYCAVYKLGKEIYDFGKYVDWAFAMQEKNKSIFDSDELKEGYIDYQPVMCSQDDFLFVINEYKKKIVDWYKGLLLEDKNERTVEQRCVNHVREQLREWDNGFGFCPIDTDLKRERINSSWLYEYGIFELVRVYKTFDWQNNTLVLLGW